MTVVFRTLLLTLIFSLSACLDGPSPLTHQNAKSNLTVFYHDGLYYQSDGVRDSNGDYRMTDSVAIPYKKIELKLGRTTNGKADKVNYKEALLFFAALEAERFGYSNLFLGKDPLTTGACASLPTATSTGTISGNNLFVSTVGGTMTDCIRTTTQSFFAFNDMRFTKSIMLVVDPKCPTEITPYSELKVGYYEKLNKILKSTLGTNQRTADFYDVKKIIADLGTKYSTFGFYQRRKDFNDFYQQICREESFKIEKYKRQAK